MDSVGNLTLNAQLHCPASSAESGKHNLESQDVYSEDSWYRTTHEHLRQEEAAFNLKFTEYRRTAGFVCERPPNDCFLLQNNLPEESTG